MQRICSNSGKATAFGLANPEPSPRQGEGVETGWAAPKGRKAHGEGTVQTTNAERRRRKPKWYESWGRGFESRRGHHFRTSRRRGSQARKPACDLSKRRRPTKPRPCREDNIRQLQNVRPADNLARSGARHLRDNRECGANPQRAQRCKVNGAARTTGASREGAVPGEAKPEDRPDETGAQDGQPAPCFAFRGSDMTTGALRSRPAPSHRHRRKAAPTGCRLPI